MKTKYRTLKANEVIHVGDECFIGADGVEWSIVEPGSLFSRGSQTPTTTVSTFRRKIVPIVPKYRILKPGNIVMAGDLCYDPYTRGWYKEQPYMYYHEIVENDLYRWKRPIKPKKASSRN
jgi:hypothetical protein